MAGKLAKLWTGQSVASRTVAAVAEEAGHERVARRDAETSDFVHHRRQPDGPDPRHELAVVFVDGGRVQLRDENAGPGVSGERWAESKIARLQTMTSACHSADPCPELPPRFATSILSGADASAADSAGNPDESASFADSLLDELDAPATPESDWQPEPKVRTCVGTMRPLDEFRWMVQAEAKRRHFFGATRKAFVADGTHGNWTLHARHFAEFVPILDFVHTCTRRRRRLARRAQ